MDKTKTIHQCLFCPKTFESASDKNDHILEHFGQEKCTECNQNLIRIGGYLYTRHNEATCIKKVPTSGEHVQCSIHDIEPKPPKSVNILDIHKRFPNINFNPVVVLEDILKKTDKTKPPEPKRQKVDENVEIEIKEEVQGDSDTELVSEDCDQGNATTLSDALGTCETNIPQCKKETILEDTNNLQSTPTMHEREIKPSTSANIFEIHKRSLNNNLSPVVVLGDILRTPDTTETLESKTPKADEVLEFEIKKEAVVCESMDEHESTEQCETEIGSQLPELCQLNSDVEADYGNRSEVFDIIGAEELHREHNHNEDTLIILLCQICNQIFTTKEQFNSHLLKCQQSQKQLENQIDHMVIKSTIEYPGHSATNERINSQNNPINVQNPSRSCDESSQNKQKLPYHMPARSCNGEKFIKCTFEGCEMRFINQQERILHLKTHNDEVHVCEIDGCKKQYKFYSVLQLHRYREHNIYNSVEPNIVKSKMDNVYTCSINGCGKQFNYLYVFHLHQNSEHNMRKPKDGQQNKEVEEQPNREIEEQQKREVEERFTCEICEKTFTKKHYLTFHTFHGHGTSKFKCEICGKPFISNLRLQDHVDIAHFNIQTYKCIACELTFSVSSELTVHERRHKGKKPYICTQEHCYTSFRTRSEILQHEGTHDNGNYVCLIETCKKKFINARHLRLHREGDHGLFTSNYFCNICFEIFNEKTELVKHTQENHQT